MHDKAMLEIKHFSKSYSGERKAADDVTLTVSKAPYTIQTVRLPNADFYSVIREKLLWGLDKRNFTEHE